MRQLGSSAAEFERVLRLLFPDGIRADPDGLTLSCENTQIRFAIRTEDSRRLGSLQLPTIHLEISLLAGEAATATRLLALIDQANQRGGG
ncbi:MAG: hypothetical protein H6R15_3124 [Proteobacteria bacterium]|nr:hypothetical protein [Pseudomonadota bacterium]